MSHLKKLKPNATPEQILKLKIKDLKTEVFWLKYSLRMEEALSMSYSARVEQLNTAYQFWREKFYTLDDQSGAEFKKLTDENHELKKRLENCHEPYNSVSSL